MATKVSMKKNLRPIGLNRTIDDELQALEDSIDLHQHAINEEGIWLFLAVLGCWGVYPEWLRLGALCLALLLFGQRYSTYKADRRNFQQQLSAARTRIEALSTDTGTYAEALRQLLAIESERIAGLKLKFHLKNSELPQ